MLDELGQYFHLSKSQNWKKLWESLGEDSPNGQNGYINQLFGERWESKHKAVSNCLSFFNRVSEEYLDPAEIIRQLHNPDSEIQDYLHKEKIDSEDLIKIFKLYLTYRETLSLSDKISSTDFSLLQQEAYKILQQSEGSQKIFKHVIIDEYQDTNTIQEKIFFHLAGGNTNLCVVGDDDQALYRFRGATVENFVEFPQRCKKYFGCVPKRISLSTNYRSRKEIVHFYSSFMASFNWRKEPGKEGFYRVMDKNIQPFSEDASRSVVASSPQSPEIVCDEIAGLVKKLIDQGKVEDPNQIAFLYPSLKSKQVGRMREALENVGLKVYAPRAGRFLEVDESYDIFGLLTLIFAPPEMSSGFGREYEEFCSWVDATVRNARNLTKGDPNLKIFVQEKREEIGRACRDYSALKDVVLRENWSLKENYDISKMQRKLYSAPDFSDEGKKLLSSVYLQNTIKRRAIEGRPFSLDYILKRVTSLDWSVLDLFYRLCGFDYFKDMFDLAEKGEDEGPICNLSLISQYLARFVEEFMPMLTADLIVDGIFHRVFYFSFLFALFRLGESEYEDADDPFPKGRIPFLTIHQSKGLEFPVVVLGNPYRKKTDPNIVERALYPFTKK